MTPGYGIRGSSVAALVASVESVVAEGTLAPGATLPPVRHLAQDLGISPTTVAAAYRALRDRGVVTATSRTRTTIAPRPPLRRFGPATLPAGVRDLATGNPDPALLPDWAAVLADLHAPSQRYGDEPLTGELAAAGRAQCAEAGVEATELLAVSGAMDGVERVLAARLAPGDRVAVEDPGYHAVIDIVRALRLVPIPVAVDRHGPRPDALRGALRAAPAAFVLTPRAQNPTGATIDTARAAELGEVLAEAPELLVVEDDHFGALGQLEYRTLTAGRRRWAFVRSGAKALGPDLRLALLTGDTETVARVEHRLALGPGWVSTVLQRLAARLWTDAGSRVAVASAGMTYAARRQRLQMALADQGVTAAGSEGLNLWLDVPAEGAVVASLLERGWAVRPGEDYRLRAAPGVRITTATLQEDECQALAVDVAAVLRPGRRTRTA